MGISSRLRSLFQPAPAPQAAYVPPNLRGDKIKFVCNICGKTSKFPYGHLNRETESCGYCHSSPRFRSIIHALSIELFGESMPIQDFPVRKDLEGIGLSDSSQYPDHLPLKLNYINTWYHQAPRLDITDPSPEHFGRYDFIINSEVFEHIMQPVQPAFDNLAKLLKPNGVMIFSTPHFNDPTMEHFPRLHDYKIIQEKGIWRLENTTVNGIHENYNNLVFHGGPGAALEMRLFGREDVERHLQQAGLTKLRYFTEAVPQFGIVRNYLYNGEFLGMEQPPWSARFPDETK